MQHLNLETEGERVKETAEEVLANGGHYQPMIGIFEEGKFKAAIMIRSPQEGDLEDQACAFAEACTLIPFVHGDETVVSFDAHMKRKHQITDEVQEFEAINIMLATSSGADAVFLPYDTDEEGRFCNWLNDIEETDDINPRALSINMIATLAHFMTFHAHLQYSEAMMRSLSKRGHIITLPDNKQFLPPETDDTITSSEEMKRAIRER